VALVHADLAEVARGGQRAAGGVLGEEPAGQLPVARRLCGVEQRLQQRAAEPGAARVAVQVDAVLADPAVHRAVGVRRNAGEPGHRVRGARLARRARAGFARLARGALGDEERAAGVGEPRADVGGRALRGLERRAALGDAQVVDGGDPRGVGRPRVADPHRRMRNEVRTVRVFPLRSRATALSDRLPGEPSRRTA
jgi:hypothetical protein